MTSTPAQGSTTEPFAAVRTIFAEHLASGAELGASIAVDIDGETVVDLWGGHRDVARTRAWERDTITNVWSITKLVTALAVLVLTDRGKLDVDAPVARYWPEFANHGKDRITVRHVLAHSSGVSGLAAPAQVADLYDHERAAARLATQQPWWEPGVASGYHMWTYGHLLDEVVRRVDDRTLSDVIERDIAGPLAADFRLGVSGEALGRVADVVAPPPLLFDIEDLDHDGPAYKTFTGPPVAAEDATTAGWRSAQIGAANGHGNARSIARILSVLARGGQSAGERLLNEATAELILQEQTNGADLVNGLHVRWGLGFALSDPRTLEWVPAGRIAYWGGWGGSMAIVDFDRRMTIAYVMNKMGSGILGSDRSEAYVRAVYDVVA
jgi:CubicO group peptidase (beta-lactamase class C family)